MSEEFKPCPFCNEIETLIINHKVGAVECESCGLIWSPTDYEKDFELNKYFDDIQKRWNKRPIEDQLKAENDRLKEALEEIARNNYVGASYIAQQALKEMTK